MIKNKKADIAITILVIGVIVLCTVAFLSFYLIRGRQVRGVVRSAYLLQDIYNLADSIEYSGLGQIDKYGNLDNYEIDSSEKTIERTYLKKNLGITIGDKDEEVLKVKYRFN